MEDPTELDEIGRAWSKLNDDQRRYAEARLSGANLVDSYTLAGLDKNTVDKRWFESNPRIKNYLKLAARAAVRQALVTRADVLNGLFDAVESAGTSTELTAAWREIGRIVGAYEPERVELSISVADLDRQRLATMSTKDLIYMTQRGGVFEVEPEADPVSTEFLALSAALEEPERVDSHDG